MTTSDPSKQADYRNSHLARGATYDDTLASSPFDRYMAEIEREYLEVIVRRFFPSSPPRHLDFACGTARITRTVSRFTKETIGVDISPSMLKEARSKCPDVCFIEADLTANSLDLGQFDLITSFRFFGNAQQALRSAVLRVLSNLTRPGGYLIINNHRNPNSLSSILHRLTGGTTDMDLTHSRIIHLLSEHGFKLVDVFPIGVWLYRSSMLANVSLPNDHLRYREKIFGQKWLAPIAPDAILVARRS